MGPVDYLLLGLMALLVFLAAAYLLRAKKKGQKCIGCPYSKACTGCCETKIDKG